MAITCTNCGEELLGSVNRCWSCGTQFRGTTEQGKPPRVQQTIPLAHIRQSRRGGIAQASVLEPQEVAAGGNETAVLAQSAPANELTQPVIVPTPQTASAAGGAYGSLALGILGIGISFLTIGCIATAILGIAVGIWGLYSERRIVAIIGISLCCITLAAGLYRGAILFQEYQEDQFYLDESEEL